MVTIISVGPGNTTTPPPGIFTPPSSCSTLYTYEGQNFNGVADGLLLQNALQSPQDTECYPSYPPGVINWGRVSHHEIYSPGVCPLGHTTPAQYVSGSTTTVICCPKSLKYTTILTSFGDSATDAVIFAGCITTLGPDTQTEVPYYDANLSIRSYTTVTGPITMWTQPMQFAFQQKDLSLFAMATATSGASETSATVATAAPSPTISSPAPSSTASGLTFSDSNGLSTGAKAGIGVGAGLGAVLLVMALLFFLIARRKHKRISENAVKKIGIEDGASTYNKGPPQPSYLDSVERSEMPHPSTEMPAYDGPDASYLDSVERMEMPHPSTEMPAYDGRR